MSSVSPLQPVDPAKVHLIEQEKEKPWIVRKIVQSMTGRIVVAMAQTLRASGETVICLSPWGDSVPLILPCIRFRDVAIHTVIVATGGAAVVASPLMESAGGVVVDSFGSTIIVELGILAGNEVGGQVANHLLISKPTDLLIPKHSGKLETTDIKKLLITLVFKHILTDASLGYFRAPEPDHSEGTLFSNVKEYLSIEKGWFNPYLYASCRRPLIPRSMTPDVVFCHGPWLKGDYSIGMALLKHSETVIALAVEPDLPPEHEDPSVVEKALNALKFGKASPAEPGLTQETAAKLEGKPPSPTGFAFVTQMFGHKREKSKEVIPPATVPEVAAAPSPKYAPPLYPPPASQSTIDEPVLTSNSGTSTPQSNTAPINATKNGPTTMIDRLTEQINEWRGKPTVPTVTDPTAIPPLPPNRRMVVLTLALSPHRAGVWTSSARPGESVMNYTLLNGCPSLVVPIKQGCPLIAWHAVTLKTLHGLQGGVDGEAFKNILDDLVTYMEFCVDEERIELPADYVEKSSMDGSETMKSKVVRAGMELVLAGAVRSGASAKVKKEIDSERAGIAFFRIP
ncbi:hypothetical protein FRC14_001047 [Serendipita sp. 396]|nr:hypothetical protein FRC14_001047 [Serendipita sp. 396]KAG8785541.1 hypothetical protein FRC15_001166 [Serendipita sp. 397]KAG8828863.1 hypothetical protein FRC19_000251 [Serendipita sp. 401]KAG9056365.1 hypothetical protein FS842_010881 [Serendipita sp. 407]